MTYKQVHNVKRDIQDLLRKPQRVTGMHTTPTAVEQENHPDEDEEAKQTRINRILNRAITYIRNGQQREAIRELAKEELQPVANSKTTKEILDMVAKLFPAANVSEALPKRPEDAPRVMVAPDDAFRTWLKKAVQKIKASGIDGISTQVFRALQMEDEAVVFIARMIERIVNADIAKEELESMSTLLLVLIPKADGGMRPVAIANTIVRMAKAYALHLGGDIFAKIFEVDKLQQGAAPAGPERIIHTVKTAISADPNSVAVLLSDISNAYNERARAKMLSLLYKRPELKHRWRCADLVYASGPTT